MKKVIRIMKAFIIFSIILVVGAASSHAEPLETAWVKKYPAGTAVFDATSCISSGGDLFLAGVTDLDGKYEGWIWKINAAGTRVAQEPIGSGSSTIHLSELIILSDSLLVCVAQIDSISKILFYDLDLHLIRSVVLPASDRIAGAFLADSQSLFLVGNVDKAEGNLTDGLLLKIDLRGKVLFRKEYHRAKIDTLNTGLHHNSRLYLIGTQANLDTPTAEISMKWWLMNLDLEGNVLDERQDKPWQDAVWSGVNLYVLIDDLKENNHVFQIEMLDSNLKSVRSPVEIETAPLTATRWQIRARGLGPDILIFGATDKAWMKQFDAEGKLKRDFSDFFPENSVPLDYAAQGEHQYLITSLYSEPEPGGLHTDVQIARLSPEVVKS